MVSSYLERPLRSLEQAIEDRLRRPAAARIVDPNITGSGAVELFVRLLTENADQVGAVEGPAPTSAETRQRSPLDRRRAA